MTVRGCGTRVQGGVYAECNVGGGGRPFLDFMFCPPRIVSPEIGLSPQGQVIWEADDGRQLMYDYCGEKSWPNVTDYILEGGRFGLSWRISPQNAKKLRAGALGVPVHPRGFILNWKEMRGRWVDRCPKSYGNPKRHDVPEGADYEQRWYDDLYPLFKEPYEHGMCAGYHWQNVSTGITVQEDDEFTHGRYIVPVHRDMPGFEYDAYMTTGFKPRYEPAALGAWPIHCLAVIDGGEKTEENMKFLKDAGLPVRLAKE